MQINYRKSVFKTAKLLLGLAVVVLVFGLGASRSTAAAYLTTQDLAQQMQAWTNSFNAAFSGILPTPGSNVVSIYATNGIVNPSSVNPNAPLTDIADPAKGAVQGCFSRKITVNTSTGSGTYKTDSFCEAICNYSPVSGGGAGGIGSKVVKDEYCDSTPADQNAGDTQMWVNPGLQNGNPAISTTYPVFYQPAVVYNYTPSQNSWSAHSNQYIDDQLISEPDY